MSATYLFVLFKELTFNGIQLYSNPEDVFRHKETGVASPKYSLHSVISKVIADVTEQRNQCVNCVQAIKQHNQIEARA